MLSSIVPRSRYSPSHGDVLFVQFTYLMCEDTVTKRWLRVLLCRISSDHSSGIKNVKPLPSLPDLANFSIPPAIWLNIYGPPQLFLRNRPKVTETGDPVRFRILKLSAGVSTMVGSHMGIGVVGCFCCIGLCHQWAKYLLLRKRQFNNLHFKQGVGKVLGKELM